MPGVSERPGAGEENKHGKEEGGGANEGLGCGLEGGSERLGAMLLLTGTTVPSRTVSSHRAFRQVMAPGLARQAREAPRPAGDTLAGQKACRPPGLPVSGPGRPPPRLEDPRRVGRRGTLAGATRFKCSRLQVDPRHQCVRALPASVSDVRDLRVAWPRPAAARRFAHAAGPDRW